VLEKRQAVAAAFASTVRELRSTGFFSRRAIATELNRRRVPTERGGRWHYTSVFRMLERLGMVEPVYSEPGRGGRNLWLALDRAQALAPVIREIQSEGIVSQEGIALALNARGVPATYGGKWHKTTVNRLLHRLERLDASSKAQSTTSQPTASLTGG
jgi:hypothetical protein